MEMYSKTSFDKIGRPHGLKPLKLEKPKNANLAHFINRSLGERVLKELFWQKCGLLKALKLENCESELELSRNQLKSRESLVFDLQTKLSEAEKRVNQLESQNQAQEAKIDKISTHLNENLNEQL